MFEKASRMQLRFASRRGTLSTEDLWTLPLTELDGLATNLDREIEGKKEKSYLKTNRVSTKTQLSRNIIVHIIEVRVAEAKAKEDKIKNDQEIARIEDALQKHDEAAFQDLSKDELKAKLAKLKG